MKIKLLITAIALFLALPVAAEMKVITEGYECSLGNVRLPQSDGGTIAYKECDACDYQTNRVAVDAVWELNGKAMRLQDFRKRLADVRDRDDQTITVFRHLEQNRVTKVSIYIREAE